MVERRGDERALLRVLGPWHAAALVVGTIVGTGIFLKSATMAQLCGSATWVLAAWAVAGVLSLTGAMTYAELGGAFPEAGGAYVFLREAWGRYAGFLYGWTRFWIGAPGSIAAYAVGAAIFLSRLEPLAGIDREVTAVGIIVAFTAFNCLSVRIGGGLQVVLTVLKVTALVVLAFGLFSSPAADTTRVTDAGGAFPGWSNFGLAVLSALWAFDGWNNLPMAAGEVRDAGRNVPRAIVRGALTVLALYLVINVAYFAVLSFDEVATSSSHAHRGAPPVATRAAATFLGDRAQAVLAAVMALAAISALAGTMLTSARVPFAMAKDGLAPARLAGVSADARAPVTAVVVQGAWAAILASSGSFDQLTTYVLFAAWLFFAMNAGSLLVLRRRRPDLPRPFRVPGYPVVPVLFLVAATFLVGNALVAAPRESLFGAGLMALSAPIYLVLAR
jgi:APA family basic amino acid/polyamine antiporter